MYIYIYIYIYICLYIYIYSYGSPEDAVALLHVVDVLAIVLTPVGPREEALRGGQAISGSKCQVSICEFVNL